MKANSPTLPPFQQTGPGRRNRSGPVPAWGLKLGGFLTTLAVFAGSFGYASTNLYVTNAPLQPATVAVPEPTASATTTAAATATTRTTTTLTSTVRTTTAPAITNTKSS